MRFLVCSALALFSSNALAGDCLSLYRQRVVVQQAYVAPVVAQYYAAPAYLQYAVGNDIQADAVAEKIAQRLVPKLQAMLAVPQSQVAPHAQASTVPFLSAKCAKCHSGPEPKGGVTLDGSQPVDDGTFRRIVAMLGTGKGIPKAMAGVMANLQPADKGAITEELLGLELLEAVRPKDELPPPKPKPVVPGELE